jgi:AcrR family transcriptional regulator
MSIRPKLSPEAMRERIITVAEEHFRRIGYAKTAVADIAGVMGMSPANIYRFFPSKSAINDAICARIMENCEAMMQGIIHQLLPADEKFRAFVLALHRHNKSTLTDEHRLHDMVEVAMAENWPAVEAHCVSVVAHIAMIIKEGVDQGCFRPVPLPDFAQTAFDALAKVFHPTLIAHCADQDQELQATRLAEMILAALCPQPGTAGGSHV